jgi:hypothetical protein
MSSCCPGELPDLTKVALLARRHSGIMRIGEEGSSFANIFGKLRVSVQPPGKKSLTGKELSLTSNDVPMQEIKSTAMKRIFEFLETMYSIVSKPGTGSSSRPPHSQWKGLTCSPVPVVPPANDLTSDFACHRNPRACAGPDVPGAPNCHTLNDNHLVSHIISNGKDTKTTQEQTLHKATNGWLSVLPTVAKNISRLLVIKRPALAVVFFTLSSIQLVSPLPIPIKDSSPCYSLTLSSQEHGTTLARRSTRHGQGKDISSIDVSSMSFPGLILAAGVLNLLRVARQDGVDQSEIVTIAMLSFVSAFGWWFLYEEYAEQGALQGSGSGELSQVLPIVFCFCITFWVNLIGACLRTLEGKWTFVLATIMMGCGFPVVLATALASAAADVPATVRQILHQVGFLGLTTWSLLVYAVQQLVEGCRRR